MSRLFEDDEEPEEDIKINSQFAQRMEHNRRREELQKLQAKGVSVDEDESESSSSDEDDDAELLTPEVDVTISKTLAMIKKKDPAIYDPAKKFFSEETFDKTTKPKNEKVRPMFLRDYERKLLLENRGVVDSDDETENKPLTEEEEQLRLKRELLAEAEMADDDTNDDLFVKREKSEHEMNDHERDFKAFQIQQGRYLDEYFGNGENLNDNEKFLRDYLNNQGWLEKGADKWQPLEDNDHDHVEASETFETTYSHRYQEEGAGQVITHARVMEDSVRKKESKRKQKREETQSRKEEIKLQKQEEIKRLKALKREEIAEKLKQIQQIAGAEGLKFDESLLDDDFDPERFDQQMQQTFDDEYYNTHEDQLPETDLPFDDIDETAAEPSRRRQKVGFDEVVERARHVGHAGTKEAVDKMLDEYYKLDFEDLIGDLPTRFKYRQVAPNSFGLTPEEILAADDKELNRYVSIKKFAPYRKKDPVPKQKFQPTQTTPTAEWKKPSWKSQGSTKKFTPKPEQIPAKHSSPAVSSDRLQSYQKPETGKKGKFRPKQHKKKQ
eukprot:c9506_g1_i1.p1 GENE.c9506_g1_i1~~c9506_g1_i1.p1  ORF type:complete len:570 (-),score=177.13 c9506_g1_i1:45-1703(-)